ncbi:MAG: SIS domain-containing protein [Candidatus Sulfotelmatobacter sp.]
MNPLPSLLALPPDERKSSGLLHTPKEIAQQPETWLATFQRFRDRQAEISRFLQAAGVSWDSMRRPTVFLIGAGTSDYIGRSLAQLLRHSWHCEVLAVPSTDLLTHSEQWLVPGRNYLWISFSRSGESPEGIAVIERALKNHPGIHHLIVTCNAQGKMLKMAERAQQVLAIALPDEVNDRGLAMTSSFSNMVVFGQCLAHIDGPEGYDKTLHPMVKAGTTFLEAAASCAVELAERDFSRACFVGSGPLKAVATESALKLLELTAGRIQTMSESALGLRHGPMAALDGETMLVAFLSGDAKVLGYELDLLEEINKKQLVRTRVLVTAAPNPRLNALAEHVLVHSPSLAITDDYRPPLDVIFGQLLGLFFSLHYGLKPDCPSPNGAISRVVQNVLIHS